MLSLHKIKNTSGSSHYEMDMTTGSIFIKMLLYAVPLMLSGMLQLLFNAADVIVVGRFAGSNSLAAVGSTTSLINLVTGLFIGMGVGVNVLIGMYRGAHKSSEIEDTVHTAVALSLICGIFLIFFTVPMARQFLVWMSSPADVIDLSTVYLRIYFLGLPAMLLYNFGTAILNATGDTRRPLYYLTFAGIINVFLNLFFVIVMHLDVAGVAIATVISQCISAGLVLRCLMQNPGDIHVDLRKLHISGNKCIQILKIGLPAGFQGVVFSLSNVVIQSSINWFGPITMAGNSAAQSVEYFVYAAMNAFYQSATSFSSQNTGAGLYKRVDQTLVVSEIYVFLTGFLMGHLVYYNSSFFLGIYSSDPEVISAGVIRFSLVAYTYYICGMMDVLCGTMRGMGFSFVPMVVSLLGACAFRLIWIATIFQSVHTIQCLYTSYPVSWIITGSVHLICFFVLRSLVRKRIEGRMPGA